MTFEGQRPALRWFSIALAAAVVVVAAGLLIWATRDADPQTATTAESETPTPRFTERQIQINGSTLHYAEGPDNGPPLLLIHGQLTDWENWRPVLPELSQHYHVFAVDCYGHGQSDHVPEKYSARALSADLQKFLADVVAEPATVVGHSSGGLIAADLAATAADQVRSVVFEDPPFFSSVLPRAEKTYNHIDLSTIAHNFVNSGESDFTTYYLQHTALWDMIGEFGQKLQQEALDQRAANPDEPLELPQAPAVFNELFRPIPSYDPRFGQAFYDNTFHRGFDHAETLGRVTVPTTLIHVKPMYDDAGILLGAMAPEDAQRVESLLADVEVVQVESGHGFHSEQPDHFTEIVLDLEERLAGES